MNAGEEQQTMSELNHSVTLQIKHLILDLDESSKQPPRYSQHYSQLTSNVHQIIHELKRLTEMMNRNDSNKRKYFPHVS